MFVSGTSGIYCVNLIYFCISLVIAIKCILFLLKTYILPFKILLHYSLNLQPLRVYFDYGFESKQKLIDITKLDSNFTHHYALLSLNYTPLQALIPQVLSRVLEKLNPPRLF